MKENDLVMLRLCNREDDNLERKNHYNTWFRVMFIDTDETFIGRCERIDAMSFTRYSIGNDKRFYTSQVLKTYIEGQGFCYSDNVTICDCPATCRNK